MSLQQDCRVLQLLTNELGEHHGYEPYMVKGTDTATGQNVALLSRIDPDIPLERTEARVSYPMMVRALRRVVSLFVAPPLLCGSS